jgi:MFS family permease
MPNKAEINISKTSALKFVILMGVVSLFADMTYEGARSITGPYLAVLGASATAVGIVAGFGEFIGYGLRLISGYISDRTGRYWALTILGYMVNLLAVPLLALAGSWEVAATLIVAERMGKAIRTPARDAMLSHATKEIGRGRGFGLHEAMDQIGAVLGPAIVATVLYFDGGYRSGFIILLIPAIMALSVLLSLRLLYPQPRIFEPISPKFEAAGIQRVFRIYIAAAGFIAAGYADFPLIAFHFEKADIITKDWIPVFYAVAMGVDAISAIIFGQLFDRIGITTLIIASLISMPFAPFVFLGGFYYAMFGMVLWGIGMGAQESVMRAAVSEMVPPERRGSAYGIFNTGFGVFWFLGSALMGVLYDVSIPYLVGFSVLMQLGAIPLLVYMKLREEGL